jgi:hypothetical protein
MGERLAVGIQRMQLLFCLQIVCHTNDRILARKCHGNIYFLLRVSRKSDVANHLDEVGLDLGSLLVMQWNAL